MIIVENSGLNISSEGNEFLQSGYSVCSVKTVIFQFDFFLNLFEIVISWYKQNNERTMNYKTLQVLGLVFW